MKLVWVPFGTLLQVRREVHLGAATIVLAAFVKRVVAPRILDTASPNGINVCLFLCTQMGVLLNIRLRSTQSTCVLAQPSWSWWYRFSSAA